MDRSDTPAQMILPITPHAFWAWVALLGLFAHSLPGLIASIAAWPKSRASTPPSNTP